LFKNLNLLKAVVEVEVKVKAKFPQLKLKAKFPQNFPKFPKLPPNLVGAGGEPVFTAGKNRMQMVVPVQ